MLSFDSSTSNNTVWNCDGTDVLVSSTSLMSTGQERTFFITTEENSNTFELAIDPINLQMCSMATCKHNVSITELVLAFEVSSECVEVQILANVSRYLNVSLESYPSYCKTPNQSRLSAEGSPDIAVLLTCNGTHLNQREKGVLVLSFAPPGDSGSCLGSEPRLESKVKPGMLNGFHMHTPNTKQACVTICGLQESKSACSLYLPPPYRYLPKCGY